MILNRADLIYHENTYIEHFVFKLTDVVWTLSHDHKQRKYFSKIQFYISRILLVTMIEWFAHMNNIYI